MRWLVYGAYGYTGRLVAELAVTRGERPVLAGRDPSRLVPLAARLGLEHRVFDLGDRQAVAAALTGVDAVAHCAGPFSATAAPMVDACLAAGAHYLDVTGEIDVLEAVLARRDEAVAAKVALLPGSGFDVVPSDCLAALLADALPGATRLDLAIRMGGGFSPGTAKTAVESLGAPSRSRVAGNITATPADRRRRRAAFADGEAEVVAISWGDVASAYHSTGIGDITVYAAIPGAAGPAAAALPLVGAAVGASPALQGLLTRLAGRLPGPSRRARRRSRGQVWGEATDAAGRTVAGTVTTPNGYSLTADSVVRIVQRLAAGGVPPGAHTPSQAHGPQFVAELDGVIVRPPS